MSIARRLKRAFRAAIPPVLFLSLTCYFGWSATQGDRGLNGYPQRQADLIAAKADLGRADAERTLWEKRVVSLRPEHLDPDALDERGRAVLGFSEPNDIVILYPGGPKLF